MDGKYRTSNSVWDGRSFDYAAQAETVLGLPVLSGAGGGAPLGLADIAIARRVVRPGGSTFGRDDSSCSKTGTRKTAPRRGSRPTWCRSRQARDLTFPIPDPRGISRDQQNQTVSIDLYIPKDAKAGKYVGAVTVDADG